MKPMRMPFLIRVAKSQRGQAITEFALVLPLFALVFFAIVEFSHLFYTKLTVQEALREAGRFMVTGQTSQDSDGNNLPRDQAIQKVFCANLIGTGLSCPALGTGFTLECVGVDSCPLGGGPNQTVIATVTVTKPWFTGLLNQFAPGGVTITASTTWRNEPFS